ncbi:hypothetical protein A9Q83_01965 [Alphaproteobacteria bacterium 46_93_T64]|nr:hypothetical protein A9Q83_01965 [Alphaproteobacteria bacterium 46_93_T64]
MSDVILPGQVNGNDIVRETRTKFLSLPTLLMSGFTGNTFETGDEYRKMWTYCSSPFTKLKLSEAPFKAKSS